MLKKISALLLVFALLFSFAACGKQKEEGGQEGAPAPSADGNAFSINGLEFSLDKEASFKGLGYRISGDFNENEHSEYIPYVQYNFYQEDGSNLLYFRIFYYKDKDDAAAMKDLGIEGDIKVEERKTEAVEYGFYAQPRDDGGTIHYCFLHRGGDTYVVNFVSRYDISDFEAKVINSLAF